MNLDSYKLQCVVVVELTNSVLFFRHSLGNYLLLHQGVVNFPFLLDASIVRFTIETSSASAYIISCYCQQKVVKVLSFFVMTAAYRLTKLTLLGRM